MPIDPYMIMYKEGLPSSFKHNMYKCNTHNLFTEYPSNIGTLINQYFNLDCLDRAMSSHYVWYKKSPLMSYEQSYPSSQISNIALQNWPCFGNLHIYHTLLN